MVKNSLGSSARALAYCNPHSFTLFHTKSTLWYSAFLAILVIVCAQLIVAENLICLSNLWSSYEPRHHHAIANAAGRLHDGPSTYLLELRVCGLIAGVLVCLKSAMPVSIVMQARSRVVTRVQLDRKFAVRLLDFELSCCRRDAQGVIVCSLKHHVGKE